MPRFARGITLIETLIYLAIMAILIPAFAALALQAVESGAGAAGKGHVNDSGLALLGMLEHEVTEASAVGVSASTLGGAFSTLVFKGKDGVTITLDVLQSVVVRSNTSTNVRRVRFQKGTETVWLTDRDVEVVAWQVDAVRNSTAILTGLRFSWTLRPLNPSSSAYRQGVFSGTATFDLFPQTVEE